MSSPAPSDRPLRALVVASGAAGLAYEISWSRQLGLTFGQTARSAAIVLAAYFLGMALGYALAGARSARMRHPLVGFAAAEVLAGLWALAVPAGLALAPAGVSGLVPRVVLAVVVLLPGTTALGASLPFVAQAAGAGRQGAAPAVARVYAANLAGAVLGVSATTASLAPIGVVTTSWLAALVSLTVGAVAWMLRTRFPHTPAPAREPARTHRVWVAAAAVSGFGAIGAQVLYVRLFSLVFHNSTYTFAAILLVVLVALSVASTVGATLLRRVRPEAAVLAACVTAAAGLPLSVAAFLQLQGIRYVGWGDGIVSYLLAALAVVAGVVFVPVFAMGLVLPLAWHLAGADERPGPVVGWLTTANTLGAAFGATVTSFLWLPQLDLLGSLAAVAALYLLLAVAVVARTPSLPRWRWGLAVAAAAGVAVASTVVAARVPTVRHREVLVERFAGAYGWTDVTTDERGYRLAIRQNVHYGLGSRASSAMQLRQGQFPLLLHPDPVRVAFIGLATGVTASAALDVPSVTSVTVMELIPEVVAAARRFEAENRGLLDDPRVTLQVGDGRALLGAPSDRYDVVVSDLFVPWESKTGYLYTVEHFEAVRARLEDDGVFCLWLAGWQVGETEFEIIAQSLRRAFPHVALFELADTDERPLFAFVATTSSREFERAFLEAGIQRLRPPPRGRERVLVSVDEVASRYLGDWSLQPDVPTNTDEHPIVEFWAPVTQRRKGAQLREERFHAYVAEQLRSLPHDAFRFPAPRAPGEAP